MANIDKAFRTENGLSLDDIAGVFSGTNDPSQSPGEVAPRGSVFLRKPSPSGTGSIWLKYGDLDIEWARLSTAAGEPRYGVIFGYASTANAIKWLELFSGISSNDSPLVLPEASQIVSLSLAVESPAIATFEIYKNQTTLVDSLVLNNESTKTKIGLTHLLSANDTLSARISVGKAKAILLNVFLRVI